MKTTLNIIVMSVFLFSFNSYSQDELKIINISENQGVTCHVIVKLQSENLADYKKVGYCIDGELLQNIYEYPFIVEFHSRDFENGKYKLSARGILTSEKQRHGIVYSDASFQDHY